VCRWLGDAGRKAFPEALSTKLEKEDSTLLPRGDQFHPLILLLRRLNTVVIDPLDCSLEPQLRGAAMAEVLDAVLLAPFPIPRGFTTVMTVPCSSIRLSVDANTVENDVSTSTQETTNDGQNENRVMSTLIQNYSTNISFVSFSVSRLTPLVCQIVTQTMNGAFGRLYVTFQVNIR
jgi:hypothetical protein